MHIAIVNSEYPSPSGFDQGGIATYSYAMARALAGQGHKIELLLREGITPENLPDTVSVHYYKFKPLRKDIRMMRFFRKDISDWELGHSQYIYDLLISIHRNDKIDIAEFPDYGGLASACRPHLPFPIVINFHTPSEIVDKINLVEFTPARKSWHTLERKAIGNSQGFRCPSFALKTEICELYKLPQPDVAVIRNPMSSWSFDNIDKSRKNNRFDILFAGRLERRKGAEILTKVIPSLLHIDDNIYFTFAGDSQPGGEYHYRDTLERSLTREQRSRIYFSGPLNRYTLSILYCQSSLFIFPSLFENGPYALLEAMAARLPIIASEGSGISEIIKDGENGLLFEPDNAEELTARVRFAFSNYQHCRRMAENAYADLKQQYDPQKISADVLQFYKLVIAGFPRNH